MKNDYPEILVTVPIHNRAKILPRFFYNLQNLGYPKSKISLFFLINNCSDNSFELTVKFLDKFKTEYNFIEISKRNFDRQFDDARTGKVRYSETYRILAEIRNIFLQKAKFYDVDYLFQVDSDVMLQPDTLTRLIIHRKDVCAALIHNSPERQHGIYNFLFYNPISNHFIRDFGFQVPAKIFEVDLTGAVCLYSRTAFTLGSYSCNYNNMTISEDEGFARSMQSRKIKMYVDGSIILEHVM